MEPCTVGRESHFERDLHACRSVPPSSCKFAAVLLLTLRPLGEEPNLESGANIDCCKLYRDNRMEYERIVKESIKEQLGL